MVNRLLKIAIAIIFFLIGYTGKFLRKFSRKKCDGTLVVLTYHSIKYSQQNNFIEQLKVIKRISKPVFADIKNSLADDSHSIALTFDDGFASFLEFGYPELQKRNIPATLFVPTGYLGQKPKWINSLNDENAQEIVMTADQLKSLSSKLINIGSHSKTHQRISQLAEKDLKSEVEGSKVFLESLLDRKVMLFSFPYNDLSQRYIEICRTAGYSRVFSNVPTFPISKIDSYLIGRIEVSPEDWKLEFLLKALGAYQWLPFAIKAKRFVKRFGLGGKG